MKPLIKAAAILSVAALGISGLASCSSAASTSGQARRRPVYGGTLRVISNAGPGSLDPVPTYNYAGYELERGYARQLVTYPTTSPATAPGAAWARATTLVPDMATQVPTVANGGATGNGLVYTYQLRSGVDWNSSPPRQVTAADFIREFQAFCNPGQFPVGNLSYFTSAIAGFASYCAAESKHFDAKGAPPVTAAAVAAWQDTHQISGLSAPGAMTLRVTLTQPAGDFNNIMALPFVSARPAEYDAYLPGSAGLNQHILSDGPYQVSSYTPGKQIVLTRNPAWRQSADPVRHQYVKQVVVTLGTSSDQTVLADLQAGSQDLFLADLGIPSQSIAPLQAVHDERLAIWPSSNLNPYIILNLRSPNDGGAMGRLAVRQAVEYGVDKAAIVKVSGGPAVAKITTGAIPPGSAGYQPYTRYATPGSQGSPARCKSLLASAGYARGLTLGYLYPNDSTNTTIFASIQGSLSACGITLKGMPEPSGGAYFTDLGNTPQTGKPGTWDMATGSWFPDWFGNNGRTVISPLFQTNCVLNTSNYGCYSSSKLDSLIKQAEASTSASQTANLWGQADRNVMSNAVVVPLLSQQLLMYSSANVQQAGTSAIVYHPNIGGPDITNVWLKNG